MTPTLVRPLSGQPAPALMLVEPDNPAEELKAQVLDTCIQLAGFKVTDAATYEGSLVACSAGKALIAEIKRKFTTPKRLAKSAHDALLAWEHEEIDPLTEKVEKLGRAALSWRSEQKRIADKALSDAQALAKRQAEDRQLAQAAKLETLGETKKAEAVLARPVLVPVIVSTGAEVPVVKGSSFSFKPEVEIVDLIAFLYYVAEAPEVNGYLVNPNRTALNGLAKAQGSSFSIPGCVVHEREILTSRRS
jgi:hypothetical protein